MSLPVNLELVKKNTVDLLNQHEFVDSNHNNDDASKLIISVTPDNYIIENISNKTIFVPPVKHEIFLSDLTDCVVACSAQQIRIRRCHRIQLYNYVLGSIFAEDCSTINLYPYIFHREDDERKKDELEKSRYAKFHDSDHPFHPAATFSVQDNVEGHFFTS